MRFDTIRYDTILALVRMMSLLPLSCQLDIQWPDDTYHRLTLKFEDQGSVPLAACLSTYNNSESKCLRCWLMLMYGVRVCCLALVSVFEHVRLLCVLVAFSLFAGVVRIVLVF